VLRRLLATTATAVILGAGLVSAPASAAPAAPAVAAAATCHAHKVKGTSHWTCITPGSYCPKAAHKKIGYSKQSVKHKRYRCSYYASNGRWRWKRA
jgi:hypothetical protein